MLSSGILELVAIEIDKEDMMRKWLREKVSCCRASDAAGPARDDDVLALCVDHFTLRWLADGREKSNVARLLGR